MAQTARLKVEIIGDSRSAVQASREAESAYSKVGQSIKTMAKTAAVAFGGIAVLGFAKDAVNAANDLVESQNKVKVVFGESARSITQFTKNAATNLGISRQAALDAAGAYGNMFSQLGLAPTVTAKMSKGLLTLTADLASFHNADPSEIIAAQEAAFRGEYDALQRFIPTINAAAVEQQALKETGKKSADQLTLSEKAAATYTLMMEGAGSATGDFARTSGSAANQQRILKAKMDDASASIGQALQPALAVVVPWIAAAADAFAKATPEIQKATVAFAAFGAIAIAIGGTVGLVVAAVAAIGVAMFLVWTHWDQIWGWIKDHPAYAVIISILFAIPAAAILIIGAIKTVWENWDQIFKWMSQAVSDARDWIVGAFNDVVDFFRGIPGAIAAALSGLFNILTQPFRDAWQTISGIAGDIKGAFSDAIEFVKGIWNAFARGWNRIELKIPSVQLPFGIGEVGGETIGLPDLPILAKGGIVRRPTLALIGERGPEAVVPLGRGFGNVTINVTTTGLGADAPQIQRAVANALRGYTRRNGPIDVPVRGT